MFFYVKRAEILLYHTEILLYYTEILFLHSRILNKFTFETQKAATEVTLEPGTDHQNLSHHGDVPPPTRPYNQREFGCWHRQAHLVLP